MVGIPATLSFLQWRYGKIWKDKIINHWILDDFPFWGTLETQTPVFFHKAIRILHGIYRTPLPLKQRIQDTSWHYRTKESTMLQSTFCFTLSFSDPFYYSFSNCPHLHAAVSGSGVAKNLAFTKSAGGFFKDLFSLHWKTFLFNPVSTYLQMVLLVDVHTCFKQPAERTLLYGLRA